MIDEVFEKVEKVVEKKKKQIETDPVGAAVEFGVDAAIGAVAGDVISDIFD